LEIIGAGTGAGNGEFWYNLNFGDGIKILVLELKF
jgi:hypothetical protein